MWKYWRSNRQLKANEAEWKPNIWILYYVKQRLLPVQVAGFPTSISQLQKTKHQGECIQNLYEVF